MHKSMGSRTGAYANSLGVLAGFQSSRTQLDDAHATMKEALQILDQAAGQFVKEGNTVWAALIDLYRSQILFAQGNTTLSGHYATEAFRLFEASSLPGRAALCELHLARLSLEANQAERAQALCESALSRAGAMGIPAFEYQIMSLKGQVEEALGHHDRAQAAYRKAESQLEALRSHLQTDELKISFLEDKLQMYERLVWLGFQDANTESESVFRDIEKAKSRSLVDLLALKADTIEAKSGQGERVARMRHLRRELNGLYRQIDAAETDVELGSRERVKKLRSKSRRREEDLLRIMRQIQSQDQEFGSLQESTTTRLQTVQALVPPDTMLLEYYFARDTVFLCGISADSFQIEALGSVTRLQKLLRAFRYQLTKLLLGPEYVDRFRDSLLRDAQTHLRSLSQELLPQWVQRLPMSRLVIVPHGLLHYLPFHALFDGEQYLMDRFSISYAPSAGVYALCRERAPASGAGALVMGVADDQAPRIADEARTVSEALPASRLFLGEQASEENLRRHSVDASIIHLASHGEFRRDNPMFSSIQLGTGRLSLFDLYNLKLDAELVVLSGCGTGLSDVRRGDELVGLSRGLLYAGARSVAVTLWDVNDEKTAELMRAFYAEIRSGQVPADALRQAMMTLRETHAHPFFWAPFVLIGDTDGRSIPH